MTERAQTGIDFLIGMTVFLIAVGFVFSFVPTMFDPFGGPGVDDALIADRSAAQLAEYALVNDPSNPGVLNPACTAAFFAENESRAGEHDCNFDPEEVDDLTALLGIREQKRINVTIGDPGNVTYENTEITMQRGDDPSSAGSDTVSRRVVLIDGEPSELRVRVW
jgi:hypothetical protein